MIGALKKWFVHEFEVVMKALDRGFAFISDTFSMSNEHLRILRSTMEKVNGELVDLRGSSRFSIFVSGEGTG